MKRENKNEAEFRRIFRISPKNAGAAKCVKRKLQEFDEEDKKLGAQIRALEKHGDIPYTVRWEKRAALESQLNQVLKNWLDARVAARVCDFDV